MGNGEVKGRDRVDHVVPERKRETSVARTKLKAAKCNLSPKSAVY